ncbi:flavin reductase family protein [Amycolatopsis samaneae]|uniref:Flavin reductase family protein n=1 Tax=Amycolatopsis samaneae TaxID=664691 RepID=A0ABW5GRV2_9PSEU
MTPVPRTHLDIPPGVLGSCIDGDRFRAIMSAFPSGVTVVTTVDEQDRPLGLTCSAACSVSQTPPLLLTCLHSASRVLTAILAGRRLLVNFLRDNREATSTRFATRQEDRFSSVAWRPAPGSGLPWLYRDTIAYADCALVGALDAGDHTVLLGAIVDGQAPEETFGPLMYWRRQYGRWPVGEDAVTAALTMATEG